MPHNAFETRKEPTQARSKVTFDAILEAAAQLLEEGGYAGTTTNAIAERAGVSIGSVYEYFPSKDAIFTSLKKRLDQRTFTTVFQQLTDVDSSSPATFLRAVLEARIHAALEQPKLEALLHDEIPASVFTEQNDALFDQFDQAMGAFAAAHAGAIRIENLDASMNLGVHVVELTVRHFAANQPDALRDPAVVESFVEMMLRWILKDSEVSGAERRDVHSRVPSL